MGKKLKKLFKKLRVYILRHRLVAAIAAVAIVAAVCAVVVISICAGNGQHVSGQGIVIEDGYWMTDENGLKHYIRDGYTSTVGIDVSEWIEDIDFKAIKNMGIDFVILRVGYRGYVTGSFILDNNLSKYLRDARNAGLKIGAYFVSQAINEEEAIEEAQYVLDKVKGFNMEMPIYIDLEDVYDEEEVIRTEKLTKNDFTNIANAFCKTIEDAGYRGGVYANEKWFIEKLFFKRIRHNDIWLAKYTDKIDTELAVNMWQYSCEGYVDGTDKWVDMNVRVDLEEKDN